MKKYTLTVLAGVVLFLFNANVFAQHLGVPIKFETMIAGESGSFQPKELAFQNRQYSVVCNAIAPNFKSDQWTKFSFDKNFPSASTKELNFQTTTFHVFTKTQNICTAFGCNYGLILYWKNNPDSLLYNLKCSASLVGTK